MVGSEPILAYRREFIFPLTIVILRNLISLSHGISVFRARFCMEWAAFLHRS